MGMKKLLLVLVVVQIINVLVFGALGYFLFSINKSIDNIGTYDIASELSHIRSELGNIDSDIYSLESALKSSDLREISSTLSDIDMTLLPISLYYKYK